MAYVIAVSGKGGTGKTTVAALLIRALLDAGRKPVFAVDADPNACLGLALNVEVRQTIGDLREEILEDPNQIPGGMGKAEYVDYRLREGIVEANGFDLVTMGRSEGPRCYCYINSLLRHLLDRLDDKYRYVVIDNEAGMEHLSRRTTRNVDLLLIVSDPTVIGLRSATRIKRLADSLDVNIRRWGLVINRDSGELSAPQQAEIEDSGLPLWGRVPYDELVMSYALEGKSIMELPEDALSVVTVRNMLRRIWQPEPF
jgi:CO dehydrogenase maturation factor